VREVFVIALAVIGVAFSLSGAVGILRMPDVYSRIQCSSKTVTLGALPLLIALVVGEGPISNFGGRALLVAVLLLVLNPVSSHALARAAYKTGVPMWPGAVTDQVRQQAEASQENRAGQENRASQENAGQENAGADRRDDGS
jgi:multicomponent Na+:H+ antiporter subunit G